MNSVLLLDMAVATVFFSNISHLTVQVLLNPFWAISISAGLGWMYFRQQNVLALYEKHYTEMVTPRVAVDTWLAGKSIEDLNAIYVKIITSSESSEKEMYYRVLQYAMFLQHVCVTRRRQILGIPFMIDAELFEHTFKPNIACYYVKLATFIYHRRMVQGPEYRETYDALETLGLDYLECIGNEILKKESRVQIQLGSCELKQIITEHKSDISKQVMSEFVKGKAKSSTELNFLRIVFCVFNELGRDASTSWESN